MKLFDGCGKGKKRCGLCRYFVKRYIGTQNMGYGVSSWGNCEGHRGEDLTLRGIKYLGLVHKSMTCQLPNLGKPVDWKPIVRAPKGMRKAKPYTAHPNAIGQFASLNDRYEREWQIERYNELKQEGKL